MQARLDEVEEELVATQRQLAGAEMRKAKRPNIGSTSSADIYALGRAAKKHVILVQPWIANNAFFSLASTAKDSDLFTEFMDIVPPFFHDHRERQNLLYVRAVRVYVT